MTLAINGGKPTVSPIKPLVTVGASELNAVYTFMAAACDGKTTLSGYLAGSERGGSAVQRFEDMVCHEFGVPYAIACNSGTSAILAAVAHTPGKRIIVPTMGMSAAAAIPDLLGRDVIFADVDEHFCLQGNPAHRGDDVIIAVNLFGHPAWTATLGKLSNLIEDNAQAPWAAENGKYTGTRTRFGCWSLNVHKPWNVGEGGFVTCHTPKDAAAVRGFINHGEASGGAPGLNLRMTELQAVLAMVAMPRAKQIVEQRRAMWAGLWNSKQPAFKLPRERTNCVSSCYCFAMLAANMPARDWAVKALQAEGVPCRAGYVLMHKLKAFDKGQQVPMAEDYNSRLVLIELCSIDPTLTQVEEMAVAIRKVGDEL